MRNLVKKDNCPLIVLAHTKSIKSISWNFSIFSVRCIDENNELFLHNGWPTKDVKHYFQAGRL